jgi:hypothetical protein
MIHMSNTACFFRIKLFSSSISHEDRCDPFEHVSAMFTLIFTATTAVLQIDYLDRGLKVYDATLVVSVFYDIYTAVGYIHRLSRYATWEADEDPPVF